MTKQEVNNTDALSDILSGSVGETAQSLVGDMLDAVEAASGFLIYLHPDKWEVNFLGVKGGDGSPSDDGHDERIWSTLREMYAHRAAGRPSRPEETHRLLFELIFELSAKLQLTLPQLQGAARRLLMSKGLALGGDALTPEGWRPVQHWSLGGGGRNMLRFQDALDWAATFGRDLRAMKQQRADTGSYVTLSGTLPTVLKVPRSAERAGLVTSDTLDVFVAEHIIALDEQTFSQPGLILDAPDPHLTFYFLPIRGAGQWRAAIDWISVEPSTGDASLEKQLGEQASKLSHAALEELMTTSLIGIFAKAARKSLPPYTIRHSRKRGALRDAFTMLFCAREILYFKRGKCVERLVRGTESGRLVRAEAAARGRDIECPERWATPPDSRYPGFFSHDGGRHPDLTTIRLSIDPVMAALPKDDASARLEETLPFDEVRYRLHLFQADASEIRRWGDQLAECLEQIVNEQYLRQVAFESERERVYARVYEHVAHFLAASLNVAGLVDTRITLRKELGGMLAESAALRKVNNSLTLLTVTEGSVGLLRLIGILSRKEYGKLAEWFDEASVKLWYSEDPRDRKKVFDLYVDAVVHLVRAAGSARGRPWCEVVADGEPVPQDDSFCEFERGRLQFPPLSLARRGEAVYALLPALVEPLVNALLFYADAGDRIPAREPIRLVIDDRRQDPPQGASPHISVKIGNLCPSGHFASEELMKQDPPGVQMTRRLMNLSKLATLMPTEHDGTHRWLTVHLHPQKLHAWIHTHERPSARRML